MTRNEREPSLDEFQAAMLVELLVAQSEFNNDASLCSSVQGSAIAASRLESQVYARRRRRTVVGSIVAALATMAGVIAAVVLDNYGASTSGWTLVGAVSPLWQRIPSRGLSLSFSLTCPSATTCFATGLGGIEATHDAGSTWAAVVGAPRHPSPKLAFEPIPVTCVNVSTCAVLTWSQNRGALFMETVDAGKTWVTHAAPAELSSLYQVFGDEIGFSDMVTLSCTTAATCWVSAGVYGAFLTSNGGRTWSAPTLPSGSWGSGLQCFPSGNCISAGLYVAAYSADAGRTWSAGAGYNAYGLPALLSCSNASNCMAIGVMGLSSPAGPSPPWLDLTNNGGRDWSTANAKGLPAGLVYGLSCPTSRDCWASAGGRSLYGSPMRVGSRAWIVSTTNTGATWQRDPLPRGSGNVLGISCPSTKRCFALGWSHGSIVLLAYRA